MTDKSLIEKKVGKTMNWEYMYKRLIQRIYDDVTLTIKYLEEEEKKGNISKENKESFIQGLYQELDVCNNENHINEIENEEEIDVNRNVSEKIKEIEYKYIFNK